jgi:hypothetical protein
MSLKATSFPPCCQILAKAVRQRGAAVSEEVAYFCIVREVNTLGVSDNREKKARALPNNQLA